MREAGDRGAAASVLAVTATAWVALLVFAAFAVGDWISRATDNRRLELFTKPVATAALIVVAVALDPAHEAQRWWFVVALGFSLAGDVALLEDRRFALGLGAFAIAHVAYVVGFWTEPPTAAGLGFGVIVTVVGVVPVARRIVPAVRGKAPELTAPVVVYMALISAMLASAFASGVVLAACGAALFVASDSMIAWNKFVRAFPAAAVAIMVTYHLGQAGLVLSLL